MSIADVIAVVKNLGAAARKVHDAKLQAELMEKINEIQAQLSIEAQRTKFEHKGNAYWKDDTPYCIGCFEDKGKQVPLIRRGLDTPRGDCPVCKAMYPDVFEANPRPAQRSRPKSRRDQWRSI